MQVISYIAMGLFLVGLGVSRLIPVEMMFLFQLTHCSLVTLKKL